MEGSWQWEQREHCHNFLLGLLTHARETARQTANEVMSCRCIDSIIIRRTASKQHQRQKEKKEEEKERKDRRCRLTVSGRPLRLTGAVAALVMGPRTRPIVYH